MGILVYIVQVTFVLILIWTAYRVAVNKIDRYKIHAERRRVQEHQRGLDRVAVLEHHLGIDGHKYDKWDYGSKEIDGKSYQYVTTCPECDKVCNGWYCTCDKCLSGDFAYHPRQLWYHDDFYGLTLDKVRVLR